MAIRSLLGGVLILGLTTTAYAQGVSPFSPSGAGPFDSLQQSIDALSAQVTKLQASVDALPAVPPAKTTTTLLWPFATNTAGFDTALEIANTSATNGSCTLSFFQGANNPATVSTGTIAAGSIYTNLLSVAAPGFNGFVIARCTFPSARGWGFLSDIGARNLAASITVEVLP